MVEKPSELSIGDFLLVFVEFSEKVGNGFWHFELIFNSFVLASAFLFFWVANDGVSGLPVVADGGEASWKEGNGISSNIYSGGLGDAVEPFGPSLVSDPGGAEGDDFNIVELFWGLDIDIADGCEAAAQADTGHYESSGVDIFS